MSTYTVSEIKELTSVPKVNSWVDDKCAMYISMAETAIDNLEMDTDLTGYTDAYSGAVLLMFDFLAENPTGRLSSTIGKTRVQYAKSLPLPVQNLLSKFLTGSEGGYLEGAKLDRNDIGIR